VSEDIPHAWRKKYLALGDARGTQRAYGEIEFALERLTHAADVESGLIDLLATVRGRIDAAAHAASGKPGTPTAETATASEPGVAATPALLAAMRAGPRAGETAEQAAARIIREHGPAGTDTTQVAAPATQQQLTAEEAYEEQVLSIVEKMMGVTP